MSDACKIFNDIYVNRRWGGSGSGLGSRPVVCREYMQFLEMFISRNNIKTVLDVGCGDWQFSTQINWPSGISYFGVDAAAHVIDTLREGVTQRGGADFYFYHGDILTLDRIVFSGFDLVLVKDVIQHMTNDRSKQLLQLVDHARYVLVSNNDLTEQEPVNRDMPRDGGARPVDITQAPFFCKATAVLHYGASSHKPQGKTVWMLHSPLGYRDGNVERIKSAMRAWENMNGQST